MSHPRHGQSVILDQSQEYTNCREQSADTNFQTGGMDIQLIPAGSIKIEQTLPDPDSSQSESRTAPNNQTQPGVALVHSSLSPEEFVLQNVQQNYYQEFQNQVNTNSDLWFAGNFEQLHQIVFQKILNDVEQEIQITIKPEFMERITNEIEPSYSNLKQMSLENSELFKNFYSEIQQFLTKVSECLEQTILSRVDDYNNNVTKYAEEFFNLKIRQKLDEPEVNSYWKTCAEEWLNEGKNLFLTDVQNSLLALATYKDSLQNYPQDSLYLSDIEFKTAHDAILNFAYEKYPKSGRPLLDTATKKGMRLINAQKYKENESKRGAEEDIAKAAVKYVLKQYHDFMTSNMGSTEVNLIQLGNITNTRRILVFTDTQVTALHERVASTLWNEFLKVCPFQYTEAWSHAHKRLTAELTDGDLLESYLRKNRNNVRALAQRRQEATAKSEETYSQKMTEFSRLTQLNPKRLDFFHEKAEREALQVYIAQMGRNLRQADPYRERWLAVISKKLRILGDEILEEAGEPHCTDPDSAQSPFGVGIYWTKSGVMGTVYKKNIDFGTFVTRGSVFRLPPLIAFVNDQILYGIDAQKHYNGGCKSVWNLHALLHDTSNELRRVKIYGEDFEFRTEEILAIFLCFFKLGLESHFQLDSVIVSVTLAMSPFTPTTAKQMMKTALSIAGFHSSRLLHSTTAAGICVQIRTSRKRMSQTCQNEDFPILVLQKSQPDLFDICCLTLKRKSIVVESVFGLPDLKLIKTNLAIWPSFFGHYLGLPCTLNNYNQSLKNLLRSALSAANSRVSNFKPQDIIVIEDDSTTIPTGRKTISYNNSPSGQELDVERIVKEVMDRSDIKKKNEFTTILSGAAAMNFQENGNRFSGGQMFGLEYTENSPFVLRLDSLVILTKNVPLTESTISCRLPVRNGSINITETSAPMSKEQGMTQAERVVGTYEVQHPSRPWTYVVNRRNLDEDYLDLKISVTREGLLQLHQPQGQKDPNRVKVTVRTIFNNGLSESDLRGIRDTVQGIFPVRRYGRNELEKSMNEGAQCSGTSKTVDPDPALQSSKVNNTKMAGGVTTSELDVIRNKLVILMEGIEEKLAGGGGSTNKLIIGKIEELIQKNRSLLQDQGTSSSVLTAQFQILEKAATRIKN